MTQDEIIRMAREAGLIEVFSQYGDMHIKQAKPELLERFAALVAAHEREACAKVCEEKRIQMNYSEAPYNQCAAAIRARGDK